MRTNNCSCSTPLSQFLSSRKLHKAGSSTWWPKHQLCLSRSRLHVFKLIFWAPKTNWKRNSVEHSNEVVLSQKLQGGHSRYNNTPPLKTEFPSVLLGSTFRMHHPTRLTWLVHKIMGKMLRASIHKSFQAKNSEWECFEKWICSLQKFGGEVEKVYEEKKSAFSLFVWLGLKRCLKFTHRRTLC